MTLWRLSGRGSKTVDSQKSEVEGMKQEERSKKKKKSEVMVRPNTFGRAGAWFLIPVLPQSFFAFFANDFASLRLKEPEQPNPFALAICFVHLNLGPSNLFRISCLVLRVCHPSIVNRQTLIVNRNSPPPPSGVSPSLENGGGHCSDIQG